MRRYRPSGLIYWKKPENCRITLEGGLHIIALGISASDNAGLLQTRNSEYSPRIPKTHFKIKLHCSRPAFLALRFLRVTPLFVISPQTRVEVFRWSSRTVYPGLTCEYSGSLVVIADSLTTSYISVANLCDSEGLQEHGNADIEARTGRILCASTANAIPRAPFKDSYGACQERPVRFRGRGV